LNTTETSGLGSQTTKSVWNGTSIVQQSNSASGTSTLMRDAFGEVALQTADGKDASWALLDGLGTTAAQAVGGSVTQLSTFDDWGNQSFDTIGWSSAVNYTGETTDTGYGLNNYYSRSYDPTTGSWMSQDSWRGLLDAPQTLGRYAYVINNPVSSQDILGYMSPDSMEKHANANNCTFVSMTECGRVTTAPPSTRVIEDYASDGGPHLPETWVDTDYVPGPSGEVVEIPARHVQGFDEEFPGYLPPNSTCAPGEAQGSWNAYCAPGAGGGKSIAEMCANLWVRITCESIELLPVPISKGPKVVGAIIGTDWAEAAGILRTASQGRGMFGLGAASAAQAKDLGMSWVGQGARLSSDGVAWISADGLRQWRPPKYKPNLGVTQSNFESRDLPKGPWTNNGHLQIDE
jgi:RHS repeat-associated protein